MACFLSAAEATASSAGHKAAKQAPEWKRIEAALEDYRASPDSERASRLYNLLPAVRPERYGPVAVAVIEKLYGGLTWLGPRILGGDRWATRIGFRMCAISDGAFGEDLSGILGTMIQGHPRLFLEELQRNRQSIGALARILLAVDIDKFVDQPTYRQAEMQGRLDALRDLQPEGQALERLRRDCVAILEDDIAHGGEGE